MITGKLSDSEIKTVEEMRNMGMGYRVIARKLNCKADRIKDYCQRKGLDGYSGPNLKEEAYDRFIKGFNSKHGDRFEYVSGFVNSEKPVKIKCKKCGHEFSRSAQIARRKNKELSCESCKAQQMKDNEVKELREKILRRSISVKSSLIEVKVVECLECLSPMVKGRSTYCSTKCANRNTNRKKELKKRRLKDNGFVDSSITLPRVIERENNRCYICGGQCNSDDYFIDSKGHYIVGNNYPSIEHVMPVSKGGTHTWDNIKLAHHYCNTIKGDKYTEAI